MAGFTIYPAIDLRAGKVVRLTQGDPARQTIYGDDPAGAALRWLAAGASWLHVVNLDGALEQPDEPNRRGLEAILTACSKEKPPSPGPFPLGGGRGKEAKIQFGGGVRTLEGIQRLMAAGVWRVVLGTVAVTSPEVLTAALGQYGPERIAVALDVREDMVQVRGWQETSGLEVSALAQQLAQTGLKTIIYTNIQRDGTGQGVDFSTAQSLAARTGLEVIASGGVSSLEDLQQVRSAGLSGVIVGRALYDGRIDLKEAVLWAQHAWPNA